MPNFAANRAAVKDTDYRIEIFSTLGSRGRDIMGYTKDQVIADVLDAYDAHSPTGTSGHTGPAPASSPTTEENERHD